MNRVRKHPGLVVGAVLALAGCGGGAQLEAVQVTGAIGARLSAHETALGSVPATCFEMATLSGSDEDCTELRARARSWGRVVALVDAYAQGLRRREGAGAGALPVDTAGDAWPGLSPAQAQAVKSLSATVQAMALRAPGEGDLQATIAGSDAAVQELARGIDEAVAHELERLELARTSIDVVRERLQQLATSAPPARPPGATPHPSAPASASHAPDKTSALVAAELATGLAPVRESVASVQERLDEALSSRATERQLAVPGSLAELGLMQNDLESKRARLERLRDATDAFARAHKALHDDLGRLEPDAVLTAVVHAIAQPPATAPSGSSSAIPASH